MISVYESEERSFFDNGIKILKPLIALIYLYDNADYYLDVKDSIILYTDAAEWSEEIDMDRVLAQKSRAEDWLSHESEHSPDEIARAKISIEKAVTRMHVAKGGARRKR